MLPFNYRENAATCSENGLQVCSATGLKTTMLISSPIALDICKNVGVHE